MRYFVVPLVVLSLVCVITAAGSAPAPWTQPGTRLTAIRDLEGDAGGFVLDRESLDGQLLPAAVIWPDRRIVVTLPAGATPVAGSEAIRLIFRLGRDLYVLEDEAKPAVKFASGPYDRLYYQGLQDDRFTVTRKLVGEYNVRELVFDRHGTMSDASVVQSVGEFVCGGVIDGSFFAIDPKGRRFSFTNEFGRTRNLYRVAPGERLVAYERSRGRKVVTPGWWCSRKPPEKSRRAEGF